MAGVVIITVVLLLVAGALWQEACEREQVARTQADQHWQSYVRTHRMLQDHLQSINAIDRSEAEAVRRYEEYRRRYGR